MNLKHVEKKALSLPLKIIKAFQNKIVNNKRAKVVNPCLSTKKKGNLWIPID